MAISKSDLIDHVSEQTSVSKKDVKDVVDRLFDSIGDKLASGEKVTITGFGTFEVRERAARQGVKPGTTERIDIPASKYPAFKAGKSLKDSIS